MNVRRLLSLALIVVGAALLLYVGSQYGQMYLEQRRMARQWQQDIAQQQAHTAAKQDSAADNLVRLRIPKIELDSFVMEGTTRRALLLGPAHMENTAQPGQTGNSVITGHRDTFFRHIHELQSGDELVVQRGAKTFHYVVTGKKVVEPTDLSVIQPTRDSELTLLTCYPTYYVGPAPKRLAVFSRLQRTGELHRASQQSGESSDNAHLRAAGATQ